MENKRGKSAGSFKAKVALATVEEDQRIAELTREFGARKRIGKGTR